MRHALVGLSLVGVVALAGCSSSGTGATSSVVPAPTLTAATADIVGVAGGTADLSTLVAAVKAADLVGTLKSPGPFTVFAPTNEAFAALPSGVVDKLLLPCNKDALKKVLTYHVVSGNVTSMDIKPGDAATVEGQTVKVATAGAVKVNSATVTTADVSASNGVVHIIDQVLVPSDVDVTSLEAPC